MKNLFTKTVPVTRYMTVDGEQRKYTAPVTVKRDLRGVGRGLVLSIVGLCVLLSIAWSTVNIYELIDTNTSVVWAPYVGAGLVDLVWVGLVLHEYNVRVRDAERKRARNYGWAILLLSVTGVIWHGSATNGMFEAIYGGAMIVVVKAFWSIVMSSYAPKLDEETERIIKMHKNDALIEKAKWENELDVLQTRAIVQAEHEAKGVPMDVQRDARVIIERIDSRTDAPATPQIPVYDAPTPVVTPPATPRLPVTTPLTPVMAPVAPVITRDEGIALLVDALKKGDVSNSQAATITGQAEATARRWKKAAIDKMNEGTGNFM